MLGGLVSHANARLTVHGRAELVRRVVELGRPVAQVVIELNIVRATGYKWLARWRVEGSAGLLDRPSRARRLPGKTPVGLETHVLALRAERKWGRLGSVPWSGWPPRPCTRPERSTISQSTRSRAAPTMLSASMPWWR
jgi:hypothetical protein